MRLLFLTGAILALSGTLARAQSLEEVFVTGQRYNPLPKLDQPVLDTPQTISLVTPEELNEQAVTSLHQALLNIAGSSAHASEDSNMGDNFFIRGFSALNDVFVDGMRDPGHYLRDSFDMESLEVLEGPSGVLFGRGSTGGAINYVTKLPQQAPVTSGTLMFGTDDTKRLTADLDRAIDDETAFRVNVMGEDAGFAGRDVVEYSRFGVAPAISAGMGTDTRATAEFLHFSEYDIPDYGVPWVYTPGNARPYYTSNYYGLENTDFARANADMATLLGEHDFAEWLTVRERFRYGAYSRSMQVTEPSVDNLVTVPLDQVMVDPVTRGVRSAETTLQDQTDARARFMLGPVNEDLIAGIEIDRDTTTPTTYKFSQIPMISLLDPDPSRPFIGVRTLRSDVKSAALDQSAYAISNSNWDDWTASFATRFDRFQATYNQIVPPATNLHHVDELPSFRGSVTWHPVETASLYAAYGTSFDPSAEALSLSTATAALAPEKTRAYELGAKYAPRPGLLATAALFRTRQYNVREPDPTDPTTDILIGGARAEGLDLGLNGEVFDHWKVWASYEYLFATVTSSTNGDVGSRLQNSPRHSGRLWTSYEFMDNQLEIGGGFDYVGNRTPSTIFEEFGVMQVVPSYWTLGLMAGYRITDNLRVQVNIDNLTDSKYFDGIDDNHVNPGEGRVAFFTLRYRM